MTTFSDELSKQFKVNANVNELVTTANSPTAVSEALEVAKKFDPGQGSRNNDAIRTCTSLFKGIIDREDSTLETYTQTIRFIRTELTLGNQFLKNFLGLLGQKNLSTEDTIGVMTFLRDGNYGDMEVLEYRMWLFNSGNETIELIDAMKQNDFMLSDDSYWTVFWDVNTDILRGRFYDKWLEGMPDFQGVPREWSERVWIKSLPDSIQSTMPEHFMDKAQ